MLFRQLYDDALAQASYLIGCQRTGEALVIDPERDIDRYIDAARREGLRITAVAETHIHADFLSGARELAEVTGATLYLSGMGGEEWNYRWLDAHSNGGSYPHHLLHHDQTFSVGNIDFRALHTPGHTPEHMSFVVTDRGAGASEPLGVATGDFVFVGDVGRPDLLESAAGQSGAAEPAARRLFESLELFNTFPEYMQVWPGHGAGSACGKALGAIPQSTVGYERRTNNAIAMAAKGERPFVDDVLAGQPAPPTYFARMKRENRDGPALLGGLPHPALLDADALLHRAAGIMVVDTRPFDQFAERHLRGSIQIPLNRTFATLAGSYIDPAAAVIVVCESDRVDEAVRMLVRVGIDNVVGHATPATLESLLENHPESTAHIDRIDAATFLRDVLPTDPMILDVRNRAEFASGHFENAHLIPHTQLASGVGSLPHDRTIYLHCQSGIRSAVASAYLHAAGFNLVEVTGGMNALRREGAPLVEGEAVMESR